jgi:hypothetical protein
VLVCPECGKEFVAYGDVGVEYIVAQWLRQSGEKDYRKTPKEIAALTGHEHDASAFIDKKTGLPFLSWEASGIRHAPPGRG